MSQDSFSRDLLFAFFQPEGEKAADARNVALWLSWNNSPSQHLPASAWEKWIPGNDPQRFLGSARARRVIDRFLSRELGWEGTVAWNPKDPLWHLAMLPAEKLSHLAYFAAALVLRQQIVTIVDGAVVRQLRELLGKNVMEFVLFQNSYSKYQTEMLRPLIPGEKEIIVLLKKVSLALLEQAFSASEQPQQQRLAHKCPGLFSSHFYQQPGKMAESAQQLITELWKENSSWL